jgi:hypothetical protein
LAGLGIEMAVFKKLVALLALLVLAAAAFFIYWAREPLMPPDSAAIEFNIAQGSSIRAATSSRGWGAGLANPDGDSRAWLGHPQSESG